MDYHFLIDIALILLSTKLFGLLTKKIRMPQVVGALMAGLILGPALLNVLHETEFLKQLSELGVIILMFTAGLETNIKELKNSGKASLLIALCGVVVPLGGGFLVAYFFNDAQLAGEGANIFLQNIFIGIVLTATSVSITVETLKEMGKLSTKAGNAILGAALIDDILGVIALTVITSLSAPTDGSVASPSIVIVLLKIVAFFVLAVIVGVAFFKLFDIWTKRFKKDMRRFVIVSFVFCLVLSFVAEEFFGVADITGAFIAGLVLSGAKRSAYIANRFDTMSYMLLSPIFFASIGLTVVIENMSAKIIVFTIIILVVAVLTKVLGCGLGAKICKYSNKESLQVGVGMVSRGEVALIVASKGMALGLMSETFFAPIVIMVVVTTIITPILLKFVFGAKKDTDELHKSDLIDKYEERAQLELASQNLVIMNEQLKKENKK